MSREQWEAVLTRVGKLPEAKTLFTTPVPLFEDASYQQMIAPARPSCLASVKTWLSLQSDEAALTGALKVFRAPFLNALRFYTRASAAAIRAAAIKLVDRLDDEISKDAHLCLALQLAGRPFAAARSKFPEAPAAQAAFEALLKEPGPEPDVPAVFSFYYPFPSYYPRGADDPAAVDYLARVPSPIWLGDCAARLYGGEFASLVEFRAAVTLVFENARLFSSPDIAAMAPRLLATFESLLQNALLGTGGPVTAVGIAVSRVLPIAPPIARSGGHAAAPRPMSAKNQLQQPPQHQTTPPGGAISKDEVKRCREVLNKLEKASMISETNGTKVLLASAFLYPVERLLDDYPDYGKVITNPIDLNVIRKKLDRDPPDYTSVTEFSADIKLMVTNCELYNAGEESFETRLVAGKLWEKFKMLYSEAFAGYNLAHSPAKYPPGLASHGVERTSRAALAVGASAQSEQRRAGGRDSIRPSDEEVLVSPRKPQERRVSGETNLDAACVSAPAPHASHKRPRLALAPRAAAPSGGAVASDGGTAAPESGLSVLPAAALAAASLPPPRSVRIKLRAPGPAAAGAAVVESGGPRDLFDFALATNKTLQHNVVDGLLGRLAKLHPYAEFFDVPHKQKWPDLYLAMQQRGIGAIAKMAYGLRAIQGDFFKNDKYPTVGDLDSDVVELFKLSISIHSHAAWSATDAATQLHASEMLRRARHMLVYWHSVLVEYFHNCDLYAGEYVSAREEREAFLNDKPVIPSTHKALLGVLRQVKGKDTRKWFSRPAHEIWPDLPPAYYEIVTQPLDLATIESRVSAGYYASSNYKRFLDDIYLVFDNAVLYNGGGDKGPGSAEIAATAELLIYAVEEPWVDATIDIVALLEVAELNAIIAARESSAAAAREAEEERLAARRQEDAYKQTAGSLAAQLDSLWSCDTTSGAIQTPEIEALLLSARGPPSVPHVALQNSVSALYPLKRVTALEQLQEGMQGELDELADESVDIHHDLGERLVLIALREGRAALKALGVDMPLPSAPGASEALD